MHFHCFLGFQTLNAAWSTDQMSHRETVICASWSLDYRGTMVAVEISLASKRGEMAFSPNPDVTKISLFRTTSVLQHMYSNRTKDFVSRSYYTRTHCGSCGCCIRGIVLVLNVALQCREDAVLQIDCTLSIRFEGREAYPRVHRDNKSKYCATPLRLNPRHYRHQSTVGRLDLSPSASFRS